MNLHRRRVLTSSAAFLVAGLLGACAQPGSTFEPKVGQPGKDVVWVPTPDNVVQRMLDMVELKAGERVVDLGSGDGKIAIAAAKRGARARGIEYNPDMVALARRNARAAGANVEFIQGDIFQADFSDADVITLYLLPQLNERLRPILLDMKPGTRVTSHQFAMGDWESDRTDEIEGRQAHLWIIPAKVAGNWTIRVGNEPEFQLRLVQRYQQLEGDATRSGNAAPLQGARMNGSRISFSLSGGSGGAMRFDGTAAPGGRMDGTVTMPNGEPRPFSAVRS